MNTLPRRERDIIPRWRSYRETALLGELDPPASKAERSWAQRPAGTTLLAEEWKAEGSLSFAADLVGSAVVLGSCPDSLAAADQILSADSPSSLAREAAQCLIDRCDPDRARAPLSPEPVSIDDEIKRLRWAVRKNMRNALRWSELARFHTIAGHTEKATRAMRIARGLAPHDRYVLRCAVRHEVHRGRPDRAAALLADDTAVREDPWLLAAGLGAASAAGETSPLARAGHRLLASGAHSAFETSELASALATLEVHGGNDRIARRLFRQSLRKPTDNATAQAEWASRHIAGISIPDRALEQPESWEARAWTAAKNGEHHKAVKEAWEWHYDQPFSSGPAELASYHAAMYADLDSGAKLIEATLRANPDDFTLRNNLAFCLAGLNRPAEAAGHLANVRLSALPKADRATYFVTRGLIAFRMGRMEEGRALIRDSMQAGHVPENRAMAAIVLAQAELEGHAPDAGELEEVARMLGEQIKDGDLRTWIDQLDASDGSPLYAALKRPSEPKAR